MPSFGTVHKKDLNADGSQRRRYEISETPETYTGVKLAGGVLLANALLVFKSVFFGSSDEPSGKDGSLVASDIGNDQHVGFANRPVKLELVYNADDEPNQPEPEDPDLGELAEIGGKHKVTSAGSGASLGQEPEAPFIAFSSDASNVVPFPTLTFGDIQSSRAATTARQQDTDQPSGGRSSGTGQTLANGEETLDVGDIPDPAPPEGGQDDKQDPPPRTQPNRAPFVAGPVILSDHYINQSVTLAMIGLLSGAGDPDGDPLTVKNLVASSGDLETSADGGWLFTPAAYETGRITFTYEICDGEDSVQQVAQLDVLPIPGEEFFGTNEADHIVATAGADLIRAEGGDDVVIAREDDDTVFGGDGDDRIVGGQGDDEIHGGGGDDIIFGGIGDDIIFGGDGDDVIFGDDGDDVLHGEDGDDIIVAGLGDDEVFGGDGDDAISGDDGDDVLHGQDGADIIEAGLGDDEVFGGGGNDTIAGDDGIDLLSGGSGDDDLSGGAGDDALSGEEGDDIIAGGSGNDTAFGDDGDDILAGNEGDDVLEGGSGQDALDGGEGDDVLAGGTGNDMLAGDDGNDILLGEDGDDRIDAGAGDDIILAGDGNDVVEDGSGQDVAELGAGDDILRATDDGESDTFDGGSGSDTFDASNYTGALVIDIDEGIITDIENATQDQLIDFENVVGGSGDDMIIADDNPNTLVGGAGNDIFVFIEPNKKGFGGTPRDRIEDFEVGDKIDVSLMDGNPEEDGLQALTFNYEAAEFDGIGQALFLYDFADGNGFTLIKFNLDDDDESEFEIEIVGKYEFSDDDFWWD